MKSKYIHDKINLEFTKNKRRKTQRETVVRYYINDDSIIYFIFFKNISVLKV